MTDIEFKYGSVSAFIYHVNHVIDNKLPFMKTELKWELREELHEIFFKFMRDNDLEKHINKRKP